jgi:hypothetical protein
MKRLHVGGLLISLIGTARMLAPAAKAAVATGAVLAVLALSSPAEAARVPVGGDTHQRGCRMLQDRLGELVEEARRPGISPRRHGEIVEEARDIGRDWDAIGCRERFGDIAVELPPFRRPGQPKLPVPQQEVYPVAPPQPTTRPTLPVPQQQGAPR